MVKRKDEIKLIREAGKIVVEFLDKARERIREGVRGEELEKLAWDIVEKRGGYPSFFGYKGYPSPICLSINEEVIHGIPRGKIIKSGDKVSIDFGVYYKGFHADASLSIVVDGVKSEEVERRKRIVEVAYKSLQEVLKILKPGIKVGDIGHFIESYVRSFGYYPLKDFSGHGIGRELHEDPPIFNYGKPSTGIEIKEGMVICIEPMICEGTGEYFIKEDKWTVIPRSGGNSAHFEYTILIGENGPEVLTPWNI